MTISGNLNVQVIPFLEERVECRTGISSSAHLETRYGDNKTDPGGFVKPAERGGLYFLQERNGASF